MSFASSAILTMSNSVHVTPASGPQTRSHGKFLQTQCPQAPRVFETSCEHAGGGLRRPPQKGGGGGRRVEILTIVSRLTPGDRGSPSDGRQTQNRNAFWAS